MLRPFGHPVACLRMLLRVVGSCCPKFETGQTFRRAKLTYSNSTVTGVACVLKGLGMKTPAEHGNFKVSLVMAKSPLIVKLISTDLSQLSLSPTEKFAFVTHTEVVCNSRLTVQVAVGHRRAGQNFSVLSFRVKLRPYKIFLCI